MAFVVEASLNPHHHHHRRYFFMHTPVARYFIYGVEVQVWNQLMYQLNTFLNTAISSGGNGTYCWSRSRNAFISNLIALCDCFNVLIQWLLVFVPLWVGERIIQLLLAHYCDASWELPGTAVKSFIWLRTNLLTENWNESLKVDHDNWGSSIYFVLN